MFMYALLAGPPAEARPVGAADGWILMNENRADQNEAMLAWDFLPRFAGGVHYSEYRVEGQPGREFFVPTIGVLAARLNEEGVQANLYGQAGYGVERPIGSHAHGTGLAAVEGDIESRRLYLSSRYERLGFTHPEPFGYFRVRAGFTPYVAPFEGLHSWVMLQLDDRSWRSDLALTPMLRFFYQNVLFELGASFRGEWQFNWTVEL